ncbi:MAG: DUF932 domain-containing protein [Verrucomicrobia bacterium]|jgi:phage/plasmid-like protein (TIGR03299 family)|nr:DUF932 domain-containing protein [Verrucomicrobiota bacterium]
MSTLVPIIKGQPAMMYSGVVPWHGLGQKLSGPVTAAEAIQEAHLDWNVVKMPIALKTGRRHVGITNKFAVVREDQLQSKEPTALGIVGKNYSLLQNRKAFDWFDPIVGRGEAVYHAAGAVGLGEHVWILARLPGEIHVTPDDRVGKYLLLSNSHDGSASVRVKFAPMRFVCWNSLMTPSSVGSLIRVRHTSRLREQMALATDNLRNIKQGFDELEACFRTMATIPMDEKRLAEYLTRVFPAPADPHDTRGLQRVAKARKQARYLFEQGTGNSAGPARSSLWAAYNGVTELVDYSSHRKGPAFHLQSIWFGSGYYTKARAYRLATTMAQGWKN